MQMPSMLTVLTDLAELVGSDLNLDVKNNPHGMVFYGVLHMKVYPTMETKK
jgi:hypothetical protein